MVQCSSKVKYPFSESLMHVYPCHRILSFLSWAISLLYSQNLYPTHHYLPKIWTTIHSNHSFISVFSNCNFQSCSLFNCPTLRVQSTVLTSSKIICCVGSGHMSQEFLLVKRVIPMIIMMAILKWRLENVYS